jgi:hypothetical protein
MRKGQGGEWVGIIIIILVLAIAIGLAIAFRSGALRIPLNPGDIQNLIPGGK